MASLPKLVKPENESELVDLVKFAAVRHIPLVPRGAATSGYGGVLPTRGGIVVDMSLFDGMINLMKPEAMADLMQPCLHPCGP